MLWMVVEMAVSIGAGISAGSILLTAFGIDSLIELISGGILLWRLQVESRGGDTAQVHQAEHRAKGIMAVALGLLCVNVFASSIYSFIVHLISKTTWVGIGISAAAVMIMPYLAITKRYIEKQIDSEALAGDAVESITCAYMAGTVLIGLALNALLGWWWVDPVAALVILAWLGREAWEAIQETRSE
ncbi:MAG TPA: cation transporter [Anaerolineales bacterium]|nr:cation transporter [Anaerolineales bacterium]